MAGATCLASQQSESHHPLTLEDIFEVRAIDRIAVSPDGQLIAAVIQRPAREGEAYGRTAYEIDPSRSDVFLVDASGRTTNITQGRSDAAGFWCAIWSPDGSQLAMLSTKPEKTEPRGGNNVHLYVWNRSAAELKRLSDTAVMTQTRYGSPLHALDIRESSADGQSLRSCREHEENAPFAWIDDHHLLAVTLKHGEVSALLDQYGRWFDQETSTRERLRSGIEPTKTAVDSRGADAARDQSPAAAELHLFDTHDGSDRFIAEVPAYPFQGSLSIRIRRDRKAIAILAPVAKLAPTATGASPYNDAEWQSEKRLGFASLRVSGPVRWVKLPPEATYPLELFDWSPDGARVAIRARAAASQEATKVFLVSAKDRKVKPVGQALLVYRRETGLATGAPSFRWSPDGHAMVRARTSRSGRDDWWLARPGRRPVNLTAGMADAPPALYQTASGRLVGLANDRLFEFELRGPRQVRVAAGPFQEHERVVWPQDPDQPISSLLLGSASDSPYLLASFSPDASDKRIKLLSAAVPADAQLAAVAGDKILWTRNLKSGSTLGELQLGSAVNRPLIRLNEHLARVEWGRTLIMDYRIRGKAQKAAVILPPGFDGSKRYPVITWVYPGYIVYGSDDYFLDPYLPGIYNLQLYAAHGYVILIPSIPLSHAPDSDDLGTQIVDGVLPAVDRLVAMGIADEGRVGVMGQSLGGYAVYSVVTKSRRFSAAVALAGITDLDQFYYQFDPTARGYSGIEHERSDNWSILEFGSGFDFKVPPFRAEELYHKNSPLKDASKVETPLLLIHGQLDERGAMAQADSFFYSLYRQGKTARLLRYWGESHSLGQSPANIRDIISEILHWFDGYLEHSKKSVSPDSGGVHPHFDLAPRKPASNRL